MFARYGLGYDETKGPVSRARRMTRLRRPPDRRRVVDRLSPGEERALLRSAAARGSHWGLLVHVLVETAVRNGKLCQLDVGHVAPADRLVEVHEGKGGKSRVVPVTSVWSAATARDASTASTSARWPTCPSATALSVCDCESDGLAA